MSARGAGRKAAGVFTLGYSRPCRLSSPTNSTSGSMSTANGSRSWQEIAETRKKQQEEAIPADWRITKPGDDILDVTGIPEACGLLNDLELEITNTTDVDIILDKLANSEWSAVAVTTAFYKRAMIAHQLVSRCDMGHRVITHI